MSERARYPRGTDPNLIAQLEHQKYLAEFALKVERARRRRDVMISLAQSASVNPLMGSAVIGGTGAVLATASQVARKGLNIAESYVKDARAKKTLDQFRMGPTAIEAFGYGMMGFSGIDATVTEAEKIATAVSKFIPKFGPQASESRSIAFDIPDAEGPALIPASPVAGPFRFPDVPPAPKAKGRRAR